MPKNRFYGNDNRIVRITNDAIHEMVEETAMRFDIPYQRVFSHLLDLIEEGQSMSDPFMHISLQNRCIENESENNHG